MDHCLSARDYGVLYSASLSRIIFLADSLLSTRWKSYIWSLRLCIAFCFKRRRRRKDDLGVQVPVLFSVAALNTLCSQLDWMDAHDPTVTFYRVKYVQRACSTPMLSRGLPTAHELRSRFGLQLASLACCHILHQDDPFIFFLLGASCQSYQFVR